MRSEISKHMCQKVTGYRRAYGLMEVPAGCVQCMEAHMARAGAIRLVRPGCCCSTRGWEKGLPVRLVGTSPPPSSSHAL